MLQYVRRGISGACRITLVFEIRIRKARAEDVPVLHELIEEMSQYERLPRATTEERLLRDGFGEAPLFDALLAYFGDQIAGYALTYSCYESFEGKGLFLEDLYVREAFRSHQVGKQLLSAVARLARDQECFGIVLNILRWNSPALGFFRNAGAVELDDRGIFWITNEHLQKL